MSLVPTIARAPMAQPLSPLLWLGLPALLAALATLAFAVPLRLFGLALPEPVFPIALAFAWAAVRGSMAAPFLLLLLGLFVEAYTGAPRGLWAVALLAAYVATGWLRRLMSGRPTFALALGYAAACAAAFAAASSTRFVQTRTSPDLIAVALQFTATLALFPLALGLIRRVEGADARFR